MNPTLFACQCEVPRNAVRLRRALLRAGILVIRSHRGRPDLNMRALKYAYQRVLLRATALGWLDPLDWADFADDGEIN